MRLADLYGKEVRGADGKSLGRVHEVHAEGGKITALECGAASLIERFTAKRAGRSVAWESVRRITRREILLGGPKGSSPPRRRR